MRTPTVSVVIPTLDRAALLPRAIDSVVNQTFSDWEIVLVDDGSRDATADVAKRYTRLLGSKFVYVYQANRGSSAARNRGIDTARGRYVAFLDSDDEFLPTKLARQVELFDLRPELGFVYCDYASVDLDQKYTASTFDEKHPLARQVPVEQAAPGLFVCSGDLFDWLVRGYFVSTIVGMVRRNVLGNTIRFCEEQWFGEEWLFYLQVVRACRAGFVDEPLAIYHYQSGSLARTDKTANAQQYRKLLRAIRKTFHGLTSPQRLAVRRNLAVLCRQLGHTAYRAERYQEAALRFAESWRHKPILPAAIETFESIGLWLVATLGGRRGRNRRTQDRASAVR